MLNILWFMNTNSDLQGLSAVVPGSIDNYFRICITKYWCCQCCVFQCVCLWL